jgi:uncharacterized membrane protein YheB (UPF0754 family)
MTNIFLPQEEDFKRWIQESIREELRKSPGQPLNTATQEPLMNRQQIAAELGVSLVTLTD